MKLEVYKCDNCGKTTYDAYAEKYWIIFDNCGAHVTNGRIEGRNNIERYFKSLKFVLDSDTNDSLDFCSLKCFLEWLFLSDNTSNNRYSTMEERKKFMQEMLKKSRLKFY